MCAHTPVFLKEEVADPSKAVPSQDAKAKILGLPACIFAECTVV
jgi:hypothetical protein